MSVSTRLWHATDAAHALSELQSDPSSGLSAAEAQARLTRLSSPIVPPPQFDEIFYDDLPPPDAEEIEVYETVVIEERWDILPPTSGYAVHLLPPPPVA